MTLEEIFDEWEKDGQWQNYIHNIATESLKTPALHHKYHKMLTHARISKEKLQSEYDELKLIKTEYYMGTLDIEQMRARRYKPFNIKVLKTDLPMYLNADQELNKIKQKLTIVNEKIELLKSIVDVIMKRSYDIKNHITMVQYNDGVR